MINEKEILKIISKYETFLVCSHIHPDGDAIGSQLAITKLLKTMGKTVEIVNNDAVPQKFSFLPGFKQIKKYKNCNQKQLQADAVIVLDCPTTDRLGNARELLKGRYVFNIDHHISNGNFGAVNWVDTQASSVGEMIYKLYKKIKNSLDFQSALCLYVSIMTDTGSFKYSNTTSLTHKIISELLQYKINPAQVYESVYQTRSYHNLKLVSDVLANLRFSKDYRLCWFVITNAMLKKNKSNLHNTDDFIDFVRMIKGVEVVAFFRELESGKKVKVSLRAKSVVDVNAIAKKFGGGGHKLASGCVVEDTTENAQKIVLKQIRKELRDCK